MTGQRDKGEDQQVGQPAANKNRKLKRKTLTCDKMGARENGERSDGGGGCTSSSGLREKLPLPHLRALYGSMW
jgi:hypothetical protein